MHDLLIQGATLPDGRTAQTIAIRDGRIADIGPAVGGEAARVIDATGRLVAPPFVDCHFHLDATLALGTGGRFNESGTLAEGIQLWDSLRSVLDADSFRTRAIAYCKLAAAQGLLAIRSHVDVSGPQLIGLEVLLEVRERVRPWLDLQLVAFPQMGYFAHGQMPGHIARALDMGVEVVGGIPHLEPTAALGDESVRILCELAAERGLMVDLHCDENDDPNSRHVEQMAWQTRRLGLAGRVTGSHLTSMHSMDNFYAGRLVKLMAAAGMHVAVNPLANIFLQGRFDSYPKRRGLARVQELIAAGCVVGFGHDSVLDPWYPLGRADMLDVASMAVHAAHMSSRTEMLACFAAVTERPAEILGLEGYGLRVGAWGDLVIHQAADPIEAIRLRLPRLFVIRRGRVIAEAPPTASLISVEGAAAPLALDARPAV